MYRIISAVAIFIFLTVSARELTLTQGKEAKFRLVVPDKMDFYLKIAVNDFYLNLREATGVAVKIVKAGKLANEKKKMINLYLGEGSYPEKFKLNIPRPHGFIIAFPAEDSIVVTGCLINNEQPNALYGMSYFQEHFLGVRYLMPGKMGLRIPKISSSWKIEDKEIIRVPDIFHRHFSGVDGRAYPRGNEKMRKEVIEWSRKMTMTTSSFLKLNHNAGLLVDPEKYGRTNPEFFPLIGGKRRIPPVIKAEVDWRLLNWEPCYTAPGIAEAAAKTIVNYFQKNPTLYSCSLSGNDSGNICRCEKCRSVNSFLPENSESQSYYEWANKVVEIVKKIYPDRYYGILNYWATRDLPKNIKLDDHIIPIICEDLKFSVVPELYNKLEKHLQAWDKVASAIGWWDYGFEGSYLVPAYNAHHNAKMIKHLYKNHNLRAYFNEFEPGIYHRNAPELYMMLKLCWNTSLDPDMILNEWFELAVGKKSAPYLKKYFEIWETFWSVKIPQSRWFKERLTSGAPFLQRRDGSYIEALEYNDINESLEALEKCVQYAPAGRCSQLAKFFYDSFVKSAHTMFIPHINSMRLKKHRENLQKKVIKKYTFDRNPEKWIPWQKQKHTAKLIFVPETGHDSPGSLKLDLANSLPTPMTFYKRPLDFTLESGKCYRISVWCKGENITKHSEGSMQLFFARKSGGELGNALACKGVFNLKDNCLTERLKSGTWQLLECFIAVPVTSWNEKITGVNCHLDGFTESPDGIIYFDDFLIEEITGNLPELY